MDEHVSETLEEIINLLEKIMPSLREIRKKAKKLVIPNPMWMRESEFIGDDWCDQHCIF